MKNFRYNGAYGAVTCEQCNVIIDDGISEEEYKAIYTEPVFCWRCKKLNYRAEATERNANEKV